MKLTSQEEYGLRCMVEMARAGVGKALTIPEIARAENLTPAYVGKLMSILRKGGLLESIQGPTGGYRLIRPPVEISIGEILSVLGGRLFEPRHCTRYPGRDASCAHTSECSIRSLWAGLDLIVSQILHHTHLSDLVKKERNLGDWIQSQIPAVLAAAAKAAEQPETARLGRDGSN